jgi:hypothetical protein
MHSLLRTYTAGLVLGGRALRTERLELIGQEPAEHHYGEEIIECMEREATMGECGMLGRY